MADDHQPDSSEFIHSGDTHIQDEGSPVLHVLVVGFHHKKGCVVEYAYPPLMPGGSSESCELPSQWRHLPSLALPDGSHNYDDDTAYFHLPDLENPRKTIFGISCYRQIMASQVINRTAETMRGVQKSVCALSRLPLYGHIQVKMSLITEAYFCEGDFSRLDLIHQTYENLNACLSSNMLSTQQLYVGLSARSFLQKFQQRSLLLFKLLLLERRVLFFRSPVKDLCGTLLTLLSLHPGMLEQGLDTSACLVPPDTPPCVSPTTVNPPAVEVGIDPTADDEEDRPPSVASVGSVTSVQSVSGLRTRLSGALNYITGNRGESPPPQSVSCENLSKEGLEEGVEVDLPNPNSVADTTNEELALPLKVFTGGNLCHPYLSLSYMDALTQPSIRGYVIGATNVLFKQKRGIADVIVDVERDHIEILDPELKRALQLTTEDLRFVDNLVRHVTVSPSTVSKSTIDSSDVSTKKADVYLDSTIWEGGDGWIRAQFRFYLLCLLRTTIQPSTSSLNPGTHLDPTHTSNSSNHAFGVQHFNSNFVQMWRTTRNFEEWKENKKASQLLMDRLPPGHPYSGGLSITDMKLHLTNTIGNSEGGKRVTQAVANTGKALAGGISSAKGALMSWIKSAPATPMTVQDPPGSESNGDRKEVHEEPDQVES